ncbi:MAG: ABC transporter substrate-binding protein [Proteobacteria bacterium]|nr:ABC transporter substrate-binding protein [Pseudomonadota bacterium]
MAATITLGLGWATIGNAACGKVSIAEMNWASAGLMANVDKIILEKGYGCEVELVAGDTMPTFTSMNEKGVPDVAPELWANAVVQPLKKAKAEGRLFVGNKAPISGLGEGWWISPYTAKKHNLKTVADVISRPDLFPYSEDKSKGAFIGCPAGWGCQLVNNNLFRANQMDKKGWVLVDPGSAAGLDGSLNKSLTREENWFGYYWSPTTLIGKHNMFKVDFGVPFVGKEHWDGCIVKSEQDCANPKPSSWTTSEVNTVITSTFKKNASVALDYIGKRVYPGAVMNSMLVYMDDQKASGKDAAYTFLETHENVWTKWVSSDVAKKVKSSL